MSGLLSPERRETFLGNAEILEVFNITKVGKVAGCRVTEGKVERGAGVRLIRDNVVIHEGKLKTLKRFKDEVSEVPAGQECGMAFENYEDIRAGDVIEASASRCDAARSEPSVSHDAGARIEPTRRSATFVPTGRPTMIAFLNPPGPSQRQLRVGEQVRHALVRRPAARRGARRA